MDRTDLDSDKARLEKHIRFLDYRVTQLPKLVHEAQEVVSNLEDQLARAQHQLNALVDESNKHAARREAAIADLASITARYKRVEAERKTAEALAEIAQIREQLIAGGLSAEMVDDMVRAIKELS